MAPKLKGGDAGSLDIPRNGPEVLPLSEKFCMQGKKKKHSIRDTVFSILCCRHLLGVLEHHLQIRGDYCTRKTSKV